MEENIKHDDYFSLSELYHERSKMRMIDHGFYAWINQVNSSAHIRNAISKPNYQHKGFERIELGIGDIEKEKGFFYNTVVHRQSARIYKNEPISLQTLSRILFLGNGVSRIEEHTDGSTWRFRTTPSPGGLFPIEIYCVIRNVEGVDPGIYLYSPVDNVLLQVKRLPREEITAQLTNAMRPMRKSIANCNAALLLVSNMPRVKFKYKERAYRFALLETGHIAQNISLACGSEHLGSVCVGGFLDDDLNEFIDADGVDKMVQYCILLGNKEEAAS